MDQPAALLVARGGSSCFFFCFFSLLDRVEEREEANERGSSRPPRPAPPALTLSPFHARGTCIKMRASRGGYRRRECRCLGAEIGTALIRSDDGASLRWLARSLASLRQPLAFSLSHHPFFSPSRSLVPPKHQQVCASAEQPKAVAPAPAVPKVKQALAAAALAIAVGVTATPAFADVSGLTPCSQSKQYASRQKKEVKALEKRLKQVSEGGDGDGVAEGIARARCE